jgi:hypothetical protein
MFCTSCLMAASSSRRMTVVFIVHSLFLQQRKGRTIETESIRVFAKGGGMPVAL